MIVNHTSLPGGNLVNIKLLNCQVHYHIEHLPTKMVWSWRCREIFWFYDVAYDVSISDVCLTSSRCRAVNWMRIYRCKTRHYFNYLIKTENHFKKTKIHSKFQYNGAEKLEKNIVYHISYGKIIKETELILNVPQYW